MKNKLLALLTEHDRDSLLKDSIAVSLPLRKELYRRGQPIDAVYFPLDCVISILVNGGEGSQIEMGTIGNEGAAGVGFVLNPEKAIGTNVVQVAGEAIRIAIGPFEQHLKTNALLHKLMHRYIFALMHQIIQAGACNQLHTVEERCARWLLMTHDRTGTDTFQLTQEHLSAMLGVRRATVNLALGTIKSTGVLKYVRGQISVLDRAGLESLSCPCYGLIRGEYEALHGD